MSPSWPPSRITRSKKLWPPPATPNRLGNWLMMMVSPAPALKPTRMLSLTRRTRTLSLNSQAIRQSTATAKAARLAICAYRTASPAGERADGAGDHQRDRRGRADRKLARRAEQRIADAAEHVAVDADLRRQAGQRGIGQRHRDRVGGERYAGDCVGRPPLPAIRGKPAEWRENRIQPTRCSDGEFMWVSRCVGPRSSAIQSTAQ